MSPITAAPLAALCGVVGHVQSLPRIWSGVSWSRLWPYLTAGMIGVPIGTALLDRVEVEPLKLGVGLLLIVYVSWIAFMRHPPVVRGGGRTADAAIAFVGGVMGGIASLSGPAPTIWAQLRGWNKHEQRAVNQPFNMSVLTLAVISAGCRRLSRSDLLHLGGNLRSLHSARCAHRSGALRASQRPAVPAHRAGPARPVWRDFDRFGAIASACAAATRKGRRR